MEFLCFDPKFGVLICTRCKFALGPGTIGAHLFNLHKDEVTLSQRRDCIAVWGNKPIQPASVIQQLDLPVDTPPISNLALYNNGICCLLCDKRAYICGEISSMRRHLKSAHAWESGSKGGRPSEATQGKGKATALSTVTTSPVYYQTFHVSNFRRNFRVAVPSEPPQRRPEAPLTSLEARVELQLSEKTRALDERASTVLQPPLEQSAWLQTTEWVRYLQGHDLEAAARLIVLPRSSEPEPDLVAILDSFDRLVEQARDSVLQGKVNAFDQQRINSFLRSGSRTSKASDRPLAHKLKEDTYRKYKKTGKQLLCFVFRMVHLRQQPFCAQPAGFQMRRGHAPARCLFVCARTGQTVDRAQQQAFCNECIEPGNDNGEATLAAVHRNVADQRAMGAALGHGPVPGAVGHHDDRGGEAAEGRREER